MISWQKFKFLAGDLNHPRHKKEDNGRDYDSEARHNEIAVAI